MSDTYEGPITVSLDDGRHVQARASLSYHEEHAANDSRTLTSWDGDLTFDHISTAREAFHDKNLDLIMPDNTTAEALVTAVNFTDPTIEIQGIGPAPWDTEQAPEDMP